MRLFPILLMFGAQFLSAQVVGGLRGIVVGAAVQAGLLRAHRGPAGGIALSRPSDQINMRQIIEAMDGPIALNTCLLLPGECPRESICPVHEIWVKTQDDLLSGLERITLSKLVARGKELISQQVVY